MKRDMDLVRKILLTCEDSPSGYMDDLDIKVDGHSEEQIKYHIDLVCEEGLILRPSFEPMGGGIPGAFRHPGRLTWADHDFLDAAREPGRREKAKGIAARAGGVPLEVMKTVLVTLGTQYVQGLLGMNGSTP